MAKFEEEFETQLKDIEKEFDGLKKYEPVNVMSKKSYNGQVS